MKNYAASVRAKLSVDFGQNPNRHMQWKVFLQKSRLGEIGFQEVHRQIWEIMEPINRALSLEGDV